jgi:hypothetical protein
VLVILGLALGLAAPAFLPPRNSPLDDAQAAIDAARRAAVRRAEAVTLTFESDGRWLVQDGARRERLLAGSLRHEAATSTSEVASPLPGFLPVILHVSPLGACTVESVAGRETAAHIDPLRCRLNPR